MHWMENYNPISRLFKHLDLWVQGTDTEEAMDEVQAEDLAEVEAWAEEEGLAEADGK